MRPACGALLVFVLAPLIAWGSDLRVTYNVQDQLFRSSTITGTNLTFQLYSDAACTSAVGAPAVVPVDNLDLIERLKRGTPKGGTKGPKTDRLATVLTGVTVGPTQLYLKVTGTGVTASGPDCQLQLTNPLSCASQVGMDVLFTGCNVNVRSGSGATSGAVNGKGNLIIGYNENTGSHSRTGSHNLIVGSEQTFTSYGGLVAGQENSITGPWASVTGGRNNEASGYYASVTGGKNNQATNFYSSVTGGASNYATDYFATVSGGEGNLASGHYASISGGLNNQATNYHASVSGGSANHATGREASVSGGRFNYATTDDASVTGGRGNTASGAYSSVSGGLNNSTAGFSYSSIGGGNGLVSLATKDWHAPESGGYPTGTEY